MKILGHNGNEVYIGHFQGLDIANYMDVVEEYTSKKVNISPRISVITAFTDRSRAIAVAQLENSNVGYVNACYESLENWSNVDKIKYYVEALEKTVSEYTLLIDAYDVVFFKDVDESFIEGFHRIGKKVLYNATKNLYPRFEIDRVENRETLGEFKYLNAGVCFGKTEDLLSFYKEALENTKRKGIVNPWNSEQLFIKLTSDGKSEVGFDYNCELMQTFSGTKRMTCGNTIIIY